MESKEKDAINYLHRALGNTISSDDYEELICPKLELLETSLDEKQNLEKFARLVVEHWYEIDDINMNIDHEHYIWNRKKIAIQFDKKPLSQAEFDFAKEMIKKYGEK